MKKVLYIFALALAFILLPDFVLARENVDYWYIKDYETDITVNRDSSISVVENIVADCGIAQKHGIFRVLPTFYSPEEDRRVNLYLNLDSITDFNNTPYHFSTSNDLSNGTITWKIGDPDKTVRGINNYRIKYKISNGIRTGNADFDEFYWNLNGNFWDLETDRFTAEVHFPRGAKKDNVRTSLYSGKYGEKTENNAELKWADNQTIQVSSLRTLQAGEGITLSASFQKGIVTPYVPSFWEKYGAYFFYLLPILIFVLCIKLWKKYGRDPKVNPTVAPEFEIPEKLSPIEMGLVYSDGTLRTNYISASIINLAVNGFIKIKQLEKKGLLGQADFELERVKQSSPTSAAEEVLVDKLFSTSGKTKLSTLKNSFYVHLSDIGGKGKNFLERKKFLVPHSKTLFYVFLVLGLFGLLGSFFLVIFSIHLFLSVLASAIIILVFAPLMRKRTKEGHIIFRRIQGFKLYLDKAEKYRQRYLEKENTVPTGRQVFEKLLPYAIMFGITREWIKKMKDIYGEEYFASYHPVWFYGAGIALFDADSFSTAISSVSSNMASTMSSSPSSSGTGGGGFSGGGGGGGGGGGW